MFSQSADGPAADQSPAPIGMRELPPQPAKPVMPAYTMPALTPTTGATGPSPDDSVIAKDDHFEGTFTSRGTVVVMGSVKGRIEAVKLRIEEGARVDADVIVDEAIIAGEFTGNLTCRERLEAHASGRINGRVETYKLMLHEGASVEGEMHMLTEAPKDASETIRGTAPLRGEPKSEPKSEPAPAASGAGTRAVAASGPPDTDTSASSPAAKPAPVVTPSSTAKPATAAVVKPTSSSPAAPAAPAPEPGTSAQTRSAIAETLRLETLRVAPRATTSSNRYSGRSSSGQAVGNGARGRSGTTTTGF